MNSAAQPLHFGVQPKRVDNSSLEAHSPSVASCARFGCYEENLTTRPIERRVHDCDATSAFVAHA